MRILITGIDGYLGWPLALLLAQRGHEIAGIDNFSRRRWVKEAGALSAIPIADMEERLAAFRSHSGQDLRFYEADLTDVEATLAAYRDFRPEAIVYLGEMASAPYSMIDAQHAIFTQTNNVSGTLATLFAIQDAVPDCHLVKLGTMGEYGTPKVDIPEGFFELEFRGKRDWVMFPRKAGSWYHQSKVHDTHNVEMACRIWGLRATDIMQGVVYGTRYLDDPLPPSLATRLDFDQCFGTVINRFCAQATIGAPLTPYGKGLQKRGFLPLRDSMTCLILALENPARPGEYRTFNQFDRVYSINELAQAVKQEAASLGLDVRIQPVDNPRIEEEEHEYRPDSQKLRELGYRPRGDLAGEIRAMLSDLQPHRSRVARHRAALMPDIWWDARQGRPVG